MQIHKIYCERFFNDNEIYPYPDASSEKNNPFRGSGPGVIIDQDKSISKMVFNSDLQSSPIVSMFFGDILMMSLKPLLRRPPFRTPKTAEVLKIKYVIEELKILFEWGKMAR
jgi:hypothetical protein